MKGKFGLLAVFAAGIPMAAHADWWEDVDISVGGFLRPEVSIRTTSDENPFNQLGNDYNGRSVRRTGLNQPQAFDLRTPPGNIAGDINGDGVANLDDAVTDSYTRPFPTADNEFNYTILRGELDLDVRLSDNLRFIAEVRGIYDVDRYDNIEGNEVPGTNPAGKLNQEVNLFEYRVQNGDGIHGRETPMALEIAGQDYMMDLPKFYFSYQNGPLTLRMGNQQIAWGQSIFFRVLDVPNGLDLRRHSLLDYVPEEFSDKRVPSPAVRASYMVGGWEMDAFVQHFRPTIYANPNTPYNTIGSQFTVHDQYGEVDKEANYGIRMKGPAGPFTLQFMAARRYGPEGTFRWTQSGVNRDIPGLTGTGQAMAQSAFEVDPTGVGSADEWFHYAGLSRLDAISGLASSIEEFPVVGTAFGTQPPSNEQEARLILDYFYQVSGPLRGHLAREYHRENVFGAGISHVFSGAPGSLLDQLIANIEVQYADDRTFTNPSLSRDHIVEDEWTASLVLEKYQKFSYTFPATYMVLQWMHKTESDIFGRHLSGMGGSEGESAKQNSQPSSANYIAFAVQQPFPNLIWRADFAALYDVEGGLLLQPALRWKPGGPWAVEAFYNLVDGDLGSKEPTYNALSTTDYADELTMRVTYQF